MAEFPALPLWTDAYLADTGHLTAIEHGAYLLLLMTMWRAGGRLPNDDKKLARFARLTAGQWRRIKPTMMEFFTDHGDEISQGRLTDELTFVRQHSMKQSDNAKARWLKNKNTGNATAMPDACQTDAPTPTPTPIIKEPPPPLGASPLSEPERKKSNGAKRGTRLDPDWRPSAEHFKLGAGIGLTVGRVEAEADKFRDYWLAKPGNGGVKLDWSRTFNNWLRKAREYDAGSDRREPGGVVAAMHRVISLGDHPRPDDDGF